MNNITYDGRLDIADLKFIDMSDNELEKHIVRKGDVLFNRADSKELVGKTRVFDLDELIIIAGYIIRLRLNERAVPQYISAVLNSDYGNRTLDQGRQIVHLESEKDIGGCEMIY
jgi:type I restriction enzyme S subunit